MKAGFCRETTKIVFAAPRTTLVSELELLFKPVFCSFGSVFGSPRSPASLKSKIAACVMSIIVLTSLSCHVALLVISLTRGFEHGSIRRGSTFVRLACSTAILAVLIHRSYEIIALRSQLLSLYSRLPVLDPSSIQLGTAKLVIWSTAAAVWLQIGYATFQGFLPDANETSLAAYFKELWFGLDAKRHLSPFVARCLWNVESLVFVVTTDAVVYGPSLFYVTACFLLRARLRDFRLSLGRQKWKSAATLSTVTPRALRDLQALHSVLTDAAQQLEDTFSPIVFCSYVACLVHLVTDLYNFFDRNLLYFSGAPGEILWARRVMTYFKFGLVVWFFLLLSAAAALVNEEPSRTLPVAEKMILDVDEFSVASSFRASFLLARFSRPFVQLTAWQVFVISRSFVFTVVGAILTYGVIVLQFVHLGNEPISTK
ncbi:unnamed protein product [Ixodes hexagonus]